MGNGDSLTTLEPRPPTTDFSFILFSLQTADRNIRDLNEKTDRRIRDLNEKMDKVIVDTAEIKAVKKAEDKEHQKKQSTTRNKIMLGSLLVGIATFCSTVAATLINLFII